MKGLRKGGKSDAASEGAASDTEGSKPEHRSAKKSRS